MVHNLCITKYLSWVEPLRLKFRNGPKTFSVTLRTSSVVIVSIFITSRLEALVMAITGAGFLVKFDGIFVMLKRYAVRVLIMGNQQ